MPGASNRAIVQAVLRALGEQIANELVDWFNAVDATYKAELRELNELNFARFDAKVEQRFAESDARLERHIADFRSSVEDKLIAQTRFLYLALASILLAIIGLR